MKKSCPNIENTAWPSTLVSSNWEIGFAGGLRTACLSRSSAGTPGPTRETLWSVLHLCCVLISTCCWWPPPWRGLHTQPSSNARHYSSTYVQQPHFHQTHKCHLVLQTQHPTWLIIQSKVDQEKQKNKKKKKKKKMSIRCRVHHLTVLHQSLHLEPGSSC